MSVYCAWETGDYRLTLAPFGVLCFWAMLLGYSDDGGLYVTELDDASWAAVEIFGTPTGGTINACDISCLMCSEVATGISELTAITFGSDDSLWATRNSLVPGSAEVVQVFSGSAMGIAIPEPGSAFLLLSGLVTAYGISDVPTRGVDTVADEKPAH